MAKEPELDMGPLSVIVHRPDDHPPQPLVLPWNGDEQFLPVFSDEEDAQAFIDSPRFKIPAIAKEISPQSSVVELLKHVSLYMRTTAILIDPPPPHEWPKGTKKPPGNLAPIDPMIERMDSKTTPEDLGLPPL